MAQARVVDIREIEQLKKDKEALIEQRDAAYQRQDYTMLQVESLRDALQLIADTSSNDADRIREYAAKFLRNSVTEKRSCSEVHPGQDVHHPEGH